MDVIKGLDISLTDPQPVYYPGYIIKGQLHVDVGAEAKVRGISVTCRGRAHVHWKHGKRKVHNAHEEFMDEISILHRSEPGIVEDEDGEEEKMLVLPIGGHVFPFEFVLPSHLPGSFEGQPGCYVRYWLKGRLELADDMATTRDYKHVFSIGSCLDLNSVPEAMFPLQGDAYKMSGMMCSKKQPITASLRINKTGYVPGEAILCDGEIKDAAGKGVKSSKISLLMKTTYKTFTGVEESRQDECTSVTRAGVKKGGSDVFSGVGLIIPPVQASYMTGCNIIDTEFIVQLDVYISGGRSADLVVPVSIIVGTIPHQSVVQSAIPKPDEAGNQASEPTLPVTSDLPSPSYRPSMFGKVDIRDEDDEDGTAGETTFAPLYSYYDWINPQATQSRDVAKPEENGGHILAEKSVVVTATAPVVVNATDVDAMRTNDIDLEFMADETIDTPM